MESSVVIRGGNPLRGRVRVSGSKNATLAIMAGALVAEDRVTLRNVPRIGDILTMVELLNGLGAAARFIDDHTVTIDAQHVHCLEAPYELVRKMRASFCVMGPLLTRFGLARVPAPGGCEIGARPVDFHIMGLTKLGAALSSEHGVYTATAERLQGTVIYLDFQSAGATQHLMTAACRAEGTTVIENCATEPEVVDLAAFLTALGAEIEGAGTTTITIQGVSRLGGADYEIISDRVEAGTLAVAAAITRGDVVLEGARRSDMRPVINKLMQAGVEIGEESETETRVRMTERARAVNIRTMPHPSFPTDMQQPFGALLAVADGTSFITENVYENRFHYTDELNRMGANIRVQGRTAVIAGVEQLAGARVRATDLRAGAALICAGAAAQGETQISEFEHIERGYEDIVGKLRGIGADISRES